MLKTKTNVLAIDPGTREFGYAHLQGFRLLDFGVRNVRSESASKSAFFAKIDETALRLLTEKRPDVVVIEKNRFSQIRSNIRLAVTVFRLRSLARLRRIPVVELDPRTIRLIVCNNGNAVKVEVARTIAVRYPELKAYLTSDRKWKVRYYLNIFDAVACGLAYSLRESGTDEKQN